MAIIADWRGLWGTADASSGTRGVGPIMAYCASGAWIGLAVLYLLNIHAGTWVLAYVAVWTGLAFLRLGARG